MGRCCAYRPSLLSDYLDIMVAKKEYLNEPSWRHVDRKEPLPLEDLGNRKGGKLVFCEHCRKMKPRNSRPKVKGWKCCECERKKHENK